MFVVSVYPSLTSFSGIFRKPGLPEAGSSERVPGSNGLGSRIPGPLGIYIFGNVFLIPVTLGNFTNDLNSANDLEQRLGVTV